MNSSVKYGLDVKQYAERGLFEKGVSLGGKPVSEITNMFIYKSWAELTGCQARLKTTEAELRAAIAAMTLQVSCDGDWALVRLLGSSQ